MSALNDLLEETGDEAIDSIKRGFKDLLGDARKESKQVVKDTAKKVEKWVSMRAQGEIDDDELNALLRARKRTVQQFLLQQEIGARAALERVTVGLIDLVTDKFIGRIF
jgi:uncharacterized membrane protein